MFQVRAPTESEQQKKMFIAINAYNMQCCVLSISTLELTEGKKTMLCAKRFETKHEIHKILAK